ncbi:MAG: hypothetical protein ABL903_14180, partial [Methylococcales bacterium]
TLNYAYEKIFQFLSGAKELNCINGNLTIITKEGNQYPPENNAATSTSTQNNSREALINGFVSICKKFAGSAYKQCLESARKTILEQTPEAK